MTIRVNEETIKPIWYTPIEEEKEKTEGKADCSEFQLTPITGDKWFEITCEWRRVDGQVILSHKGRKLSLMRGLTGWRNVLGKNGDLDFTENNVDKLHSSLKYELALKIVEISQLSEEQEKN